MVGSAPLTYSGVADRCGLGQREVVAIKWSPWALGRRTEKLKDLRKPKTKHDPGEAIP
jgi:hypothetical protein